MATYSESRVGRSLSADELDLDTEASASARILQRQQREADARLRQNANHHQYPDPHSTGKPRSGLLKRLRNVFRTNAGTVRSNRFEKSPRATVDILPEDAIAAQPQSIPNSRRAQRPNYVQQPPNQRFDSRGVDPRTTPHFPASRMPHPEDLSARAIKGKPTYNTNSTGRSRSWRPGGLTSSARVLSVERQGSELGDTTASKQSRFLAMANETSKRNHSLNGPSSSPSTGSIRSHQNSSSSGPSSRNGSHRSLPKRVFSSPPSLSARSFVFGPRKRSSASSKTPRRSTSALGSNDNLTAQSSADSDSSRKLSLSFGGRQGGAAFHSRGSLKLSVGTGLSPNTPFVSPENNADTFKLVVEGAVEGKVSFSTLLDAMFRLEERLPQDVKDTLIKYLSRQDNIEALIDRLTVVLPILADDDGVEGPSGERVRYRHSYVASMLLSNGPIQLRRCLFSDSRHLDRLVGVLQHGSPSDPVLVRSVCKVLLSVLRDSADDTVAAMTRRRDFLDVLLSHIAVTGCPEVCLSMLSTVRCQQELKFGPANRPIVCMMADAKLLPTLCDKLAAAAENGPLTSESSATIENCSRVIVGIALRVLVISRFEINDDDDSDANFMIKFNRDLASLDVFNQPMPILRVLDSGFAAMYSHDERGYALATALTAVRYMLVTVINGQDSSLSTIRLQLDSLNTGAYEAGVRARIPMLARVLSNARNGVSIETMWDRVEGPLGVVRLKILELLVVLLQHGSEKTAQAIVDANIPQILFALFERLELNSLLHHMVASIVELSLASSYPCVRHAFLLDVRLLDMCMRLWKVPSKRSRCEGETGSNRTGELVRMSRAAEEFLANRNSPEVEELLGHLGDQVQQFGHFCDHEVADYELLNVQLLGGADHLPRRVDDGFGSMDGFGFGSQGALFFRSRAAGAVANT